MPLANRVTYSLLHETPLFALLPGLMSAYDLTGDALFLEKATDLADRLVPAFLVCPKTGAYGAGGTAAAGAPGALAPLCVLLPAKLLVLRCAGIPDNAARLPRADGGSSKGLAVLAELGTATMEWGVLSLRGGNATYRKLAERPVRYIWHKLHPNKVGVLPLL